jgi:hypothetical protein
MPASFRRGGEMEERHPVMAWSPTVDELLGRAVL